MKAFFSRYFYTMIRLFLNQFAIALFGVALALATGQSESRTLQLVTGIFSVLFYLFLQYVAMWEVGAKDGLVAAARKQKRGLWRGLVIALLANAVNLILALLTVPGAFLPKGTTWSGVGSVASVIALLLQGMYMGILATPLNGLNLNQYSWAYFAIIVPAVLVCSIAYILGSYNIHFTNILIPKNQDVKNNGRPE